MARGEVGEVERERTGCKGGEEGGRWVETALGRNNIRFLDSLLT